ncbi:MAG: PAS domain S-box protein [Rhizobiales bacterium]|nr:PAS domain S-box protein [Hyphomicrobiales bacterium]
MSETNFMLQGIRDPRLAVYATGSTPAWLWSSDGSRVLWCNPVGLRVFGMANADALAAKSFSPADPLRRQVMQLATRLPENGAVRLEKLRGFGAALGQLQTCACTRVPLPDGTTAILVAAADHVARPMPLAERIGALLDSITSPALAFTPDGALAAANDAAKKISAYLDHLSGDQLDTVLRDGEAKLVTDFGNGTLHRAGAGHDTVLVALLDKVKIPERASAPLPMVEAAAIEATPAADAIQATSELLPTDVLESVFEDDAELQTSLPPEEIDMPQPPQHVQDVSETIAPEPPTVTEPVRETNHVSATLAEMDGPHLTTRRHPLRFMWQMDEDSRFSLGSDEFSRLIGSRTAAAFGRLWNEIASALKIDPEGKVAAAVATRGTWSGIVVDWPADGSGARLPVELSGLPVFDRERNFIGYRGFGVCRDLEGLARLAAQRRDEVLYSGSTPTSSAPAVQESVTAESDAPVEAPQNILPFRPVSEPKSPVLTVVESKAFDELGRRISAELETDNGSTAMPTAANDSTPPVAEKPPLENPPAFLQPEALPPRATSAHDSLLLDRLPAGVLIYRIDRLIYANRTFLEQTGFSGLHELTEAGGLDALFVEPISGTGVSTSEEGAPVTISTTKTGRAESHSARLFSISWDDEPAMALIFSGAPRISTQQPAAVPAADSTQAEELATILDTTAEGVVMIDGLGRILSCNRSAEALFGRTSDDIASLNLIDLFAPESQKAALDHLENAKSATIASLLDHGRETLGKTRGGGTIPLSMTIGRTRPDSPRFFAVFRDLSQTKKSEGDLLQARRQSERATSAKTDVLGRISHEVRMPLNAIIGFADVMIEERFGPLGNERYVEYMKDIRASGQRVMAIIDDLLDLSRIESGKIELSFASQDLNQTIEQCVAVMQPQANRERIIIRTSLAHSLPSVKADARALRQIAMNLIGSSIHLANAGGQVIVSTATTDFGDIALRVRDTGPGMNDNEIAAAMAPFRTAAAMDQIATDNSAVSLSLTKALVEANKAKFNIKTAPHSGTLIEVVFAHASAIA